MLEIIANFIHWYGTIAILGAYALSLAHVIPFQSDMFYLMNLTGSIALIIGSAFKKSLWHNVVFYIIWALITGLIYFSIIPIK